jgi:hypothetical protein
MAAAAAALAELGLSVPPTVKRPASLMDTDSGTYSPLAFFTDEIICDG